VKLHTPHYHVTSNFFRNAGSKSGWLLTLVGFTAYFAGNPTQSSRIFLRNSHLTRGLALKAAELKPVVFATTPEVLALQRQATTTQNQIRQDLRRYRYGQDAHLDSLYLTSVLALQRGTAGNQRLRETAIEGAYALILNLIHPDSPQVWQQKQQKMESFLVLESRLKAQPTEDAIDLALITTSKAEG